MAFESILDEVDQLHNVSTRLEGLADHHPPLTEALMTIAGNVRSVATVIGSSHSDKARGGWTDFASAAQLRPEMCTIAHMNGKQKTV